MNLPFKNLKISLRLKIAIGFLFLVITMMITVTYIFTIRELNLRVEQVELRMERLANNITSILSVETEDWDVYQTYIDNQMKLNPDIVYIAIFDEETELKVHVLNFDWIDFGGTQELSPIEERNIIHQLEQRLIAEESQKDLESKSVNINAGDRYLGTVKVGFSLVDLNDAMRENLLRNFTLAIIFILLAIIIAFVTSYKIVTPLEKLTTAMLNISRGNLKQKIYIKSSDEIGDMADAFNFMVNGLQEKELIEKFSRELSFRVELEKITELIVARITQALNAGAGFIFLRERTQPDRVKLMNCYPGSCPTGEIMLSCTQELHQIFITTNKPISLELLANFPEFINQLNDNASIRDTNIITPIIIRNELLGLFLLSKPKVREGYTEVEQTFLATLVNQGSFAIESALLYEELTEQERLKHELEIAKKVQRSLLPMIHPQINGLDVNGICIPAEEVGGDYFDYFIINNHKMGIVIADVTGKGTSAAFYMAVVKGIMLSLVSIIHSPAQLLSEVNRRIYGIMDKRVFITMTYAIFDVDLKILTFARAGHNALMMHNCQNSYVDCLEPRGIGLGLEKGPVFDKTISEQQINISSGDSFLFFTDGITEAMNDDKAEYGEQRLIEVVQDSGNCTSIQMIENIIHDVNKFVNNAEQHDDITMVVVSVT